MIEAVSSAVLLAQTALAVLSILLALEKFSGRSLSIRLATREKRLGHLYLILMMMSFGIFDGILYISSQNQDVIGQSPLIRMCLLISGLAGLGSIYQLRCILRKIAHILLTDLKPWDEP
jgi:fumarate reductase subunit D